MDPKYFDKNYNVLHEHFSYVRLVGLWMRNTVFILIRTILQNVLIIGCFLHFITADRKNGYATDFIDDCAIGVSGTGMNYIIVCFTLNKDKILNLTEHLNTFRYFGKPIGFDKVNVVLRKALLYYKIFIVFGVTYYILAGLFVKGKCLKDRERDKLQKTCGLLSQTLFIKRFEDSPYNQILFVFQSIATNMSTHSTSSIINFILAVSENVIIRIKHLKYNLRKLDDIENKTERQQHLRNCILYHNDIISIVEKTNEAFSSILFATISVDTLIMGILTVQILINASLPVIMHLCGWIILIFILSFTGQRLYNEAVSVQDCIYSLKWYKEDNVTQKDLNFMIRRSQKPLVLHTGKFGFMSFPTFLAVMKTSYSYVAVLQQTM